MLMTNIFHSPNLLRVNGDFTLAVRFGELLAVIPCRTSDADHVTVNFRGLHIELTAQDARKLSAGLFTAARKVRDFPEHTGITHEDEPDE